MKINLKAHLTQLFFCSLFSAFLLTVSCSHKKNNNEENFKTLLIDNTSVTDSQDISGIVSKIQIIPIDEFKGNYIGFLYKVLVSNGKYIVFDKEFESEKINIYDADGNFIKTALKIGDGPTETVQINDCWLDNNGELVAYDFALKRTYQFDSLFVLKDVKKFPEFGRFNNMAQIPQTEKLVGYVNFGGANPPKNGKQYHLAIFDKDLNIIQTDLHFDDKYKGVKWLSLSYHFFEHNDSLRVFQAWDNFVYNLTQTGVEKWYKIEYKNNNLPEDIFEKVVDANLQKFKDYEIFLDDLSEDIYAHSYLQGRWLENDKYIYIPSHHHKKFHFMSIYNKLTQKIEYNSKQFYEGKNYKLNLPPFDYYDKTSNSLIRAVPGEYLSKQIHQDSKFKNEIIINPESNYIIKVSLK